MNWSLNGTQIYVNSKDAVAKAIIANLQPLSGGTIRQVFGYENQSYNINCVVVGQTNVNALKALAITGSYYTLSGPNGFSISALVESVSEKQKMTISQTVDPTQDYYTPVFDVSINLLI